MRAGDRWFLVVSLTLFVCLGWTPAAHAYLDPGSGSLAFQALVAILLGAAVTAKMWYGKIKAFFSGMFSKGRRDR